MRYAIKFSKESEIKFISHLDLMRTIQRIIRRAELPIQYSQGFNPHMDLSLAQPLSVGIYSSGEYMDVVFTEEVEKESVKNALNESAPGGIRIFEVCRVPQEANQKKIPQCMALIEAASYEIKIKYKKIDNLKETLDEMLKNTEWTALKKSKSGEKLVNIKPMIKEFKYTIELDTLNISTTISCGSRENLSAELLSGFIKQHTENVNEQAFVEIQRQEMYTYSGKKLVPLYKYFEENLDTI